MTSAEIARALAAALTLGSGGRKCFPCLNDKRPATPHGFKDAACDPDTLRKLWRLYPGPSVGVATGEASDIDVFDLDRKHPEAVKWWAEHRGCLPQTRTHRTRSGGMHLLFENAPGLRCWIGEPVIGIDGRADGGFAVWWPAAGVPVLCDAPPAPWPEWLLADLRPTSSPARSERRVTIPDEYALARLVRKVAGATEGERNTITFWAACRAGEMAASGLISADTAAGVIANAALLSSLPPVEAERTAWSGICTGLGTLSHARSARQFK